MHGNLHQEAVKQAPQLYGDNYSVELYSINPVDDGTVSFIQHSHLKTKEKKEV
jgi:hypothetical protein